MYLNFEQRQVGTRLANLDVSVEILARFDGGVGEPLTVGQGLVFRNFEPFELGRAARGQRLFLQDALQLGVLASDHCP